MQISVESITSQESKYTNELAEVSGYANFMGPYKIY
jgi:hypothetical protein